MGRRASKKPKASPVLIRLAVERWPSPIPMAAAKLLRPRDSATNNKASRVTTQPPMLCLQGGARSVAVVQALTDAVRHGDGLDAVDKRRSEDHLSRRLGGRPAQRVLGNRIAAVTLFR